MPETTAEEFVTISRASQLLGVNERSARRAAGTLSDSDRQAPDKGPQRVRLSALAAQMGKALPTGDVSDTSRGMSDNVPDSAGQESDKEPGLPDSAGQAPDTNKQVPDTESELVKELRADRDAWKAQAEKALQLVDQAQQLQLVAERKVAELEGKLLPSRDLAGGDSSASPGVGEGIVPPHQDKPAPAGFWAAVARLFGRGG